MLYDVSSIWPLDTFVRDLYEIVLIVLTALYDIKLQWEGNLVSKGKRCSQRDLLSALLYCMQHLDLRIEEGNAELLTDSLSPWHTAQMFNCGLHILMLSHTFDLARNERGLIGDRHVVDKRAAANRCGDLSVGALNICEVVLHVYKRDHVLKYQRIRFLPLFLFIHPTCTIKLHFKAVSSILTKLS